MSNFNVGFDFKKKGGEVFDLLEGASRDRSSNTVESDENVQSVNSCLNV